MKLSTIETIQTVSGWTFFFSLVLIWLAFILEVSFEKSILSRRYIEKRDDTYAKIEKRGDAYAKHELKLKKKGIPDDSTREPMIVVVKQEKIPSYMKMGGAVLLIISIVGGIYSIIAKRLEIRKMRIEIEQISNDKNTSSEKRRKGDT